MASPEDIKNYELEVDNYLADLDKKQAAQLAAVERMRADKDLVMNPKILDALDGAIKNQAAFNDYKNDVKNAHWITDSAGKLVLDTNGNKQFANKDTLEESLKNLAIQREDMLAASASSAVVPSTPESEKMVAVALKEINESGSVKDTELGKATSPLLGATAEKFGTTGGMVGAGIVGVGLLAALWNDSENQGWGTKLLIIFAAFPLLILGAFLGSAAEDFAREKHLLSPKSDTGNGSLDVTVVKADANDVKIDVVDQRTKKLYHLMGKQSGTEVIINQGYEDGKPVNNNHDLIADSENVHISAANLGDLQNSVIPMKQTELKNALTNKKNQI